MKPAKRRPWGFYQVKIALLYLAILTVMLALLNTYPVLVSQNIVFANKQHEVTNRAGNVASALAGVDTLNADSIAWVLSNLSGSAGDRILVLDAGAAVLYDNSASDSHAGKTLLLREVLDAMGGRDVSVSKYQNQVYMTYAVVPIAAGGQVVGCVYVYEEDAVQGAQLASLQKNLMTVSLFVLAVTLLVSAAVTVLLARRLGRLLRSVQTVREGDYGHQTRVKGHDELTELELNFNEFSNRLLHNETSRRQFVSDASHELKTPLASMKLLADSILQNKNIEPALTREFVNDMGDEIDRLSRMTDKLLTLTRLDAEPAYETQPVDLKEVSLRAARMLSQLAAHKNIEITSDLQDGCVIDAEPDSCYQIVFNLLENAVKYSPDGRPVQITLAKNDKEVTLRVSDKGRGITPDEQRLIFERFYRVDKTRARQAGGAGLGLAIVVAAVQRFGGSIAVDSTPGEGSCFTVTFPITENGA